jgi:hypothetical protein
MAQPLRMLPVALLLLWTLPAAAEITNCTAITSLPATISAPGIYCLTADLSTSDPNVFAITINASSVTLDLNGHKLGGLGAGPATTAYGIYAKDRKNLTIRNGTIRGFLTGINLQDAGASSGHLVEDLRLDGNTQMCASIAGAGSIFQRNQVVNTGGSTLVPYTWALNAQGAGVRVLENDIVDTFSQSSVSTVVQLQHAPGAVVRGNRISNTTRSPGDTSWGIFVIWSANVFVVDNVIENTTIGVDYRVDGSGPYRDNVTNAVDIPYAGGGTNVGNNH